MKRLLKLNTTSVLLLCLLFSISLKSQTYDVKPPKWKSLDQISKSLKTTQLELKESVYLPSGRIKKISSISVLSVTSNVITAIMCSDDSKWFKVEIEIGDTEEINRFEILREGILVDKLNNEIGGVEGTAIYDGYFYVSLDNDIKNKQQNYIFKYDLDDLDKIKSSWKFEEKIKLVDEKYFPTADAYKNAGLEALAVTDDGKLFTIYEKGSTNKRLAWLKNIYQREQATIELKYMAQYPEIKGAATLSNGNIVILEKEFDKYVKKNKEVKKTRFSIHELDRKTLNKDTYLITKKLLETKFSQDDFDNFEGITSFVMNEKEYLLIISDDNGDSSQNTLLFLFKRINPNDGKTKPKVPRVGVVEPEKEKVVDPTLIPYPQFSGNRSSFNTYADKKNRQIIYDTKLGASLTRIDENGNTQKAHGIPRHANVSVAISPLTLRGILKEEVKYFTVSIEGKDHLFKNSVQDLYELTSPPSGDVGTSTGDSHEPELEKSVDKALSMLDIRGTDDELKEALEGVEANLPQDKKSSFISAKDAFLNGAKNSLTKDNLREELKKIKNNGFAQGTVRTQSNLENYLNNVLRSWDKGDQYVQYSEIERLKAYRDTLRKAIHEWQISGNRLSLKETEAFNKVMNWLPQEIYLTTFSSIAPDKDEIEIKIKTFGEAGAATNEFKIAKRKVSTGLAVNIGTSLFLTGFRSSDAYLNDSFPINDTVIERRVMIPTNDQLSVGIGANAELSFRTPSIVRPMISLGFFVPLNEKVKPLVAIGGGVTVGTQKVKISASFGAAFGTMNVIKEEYLNKNVSSTIQLSEVTETVWNHSWQMAIGISYNIVGTN
ncbi:esterase-like activity of phytase family protein [Aureispira sp. CCB-E]|uniref:esterase-like activity of phytase family protein n=1 Tax=Aureispira sp. CCB-E TaxID=3051121 RepID=UPI0028684EF7|nr:esterase-like activity of phytase family protein [Aureispira sp. CCB-E]WMX17023.1 esterase-like activity of phytase family protein [Aureispira sp. CCB-E]